MRMLNSFIALFLVALSLLLATACSPFEGLGVTGSKGQVPIPETTVIPAPLDAPTATSTPVRPTPAATRSGSISPAPTLTPGTQGPLSGWKTYTSALYQYVVSYPPDWAVSVEKLRSTAKVKNTERVIFKQPNYGARNQFTTIMIEASQGGAWSFASCDSKITVSGISACRNSMPAGQNPAQEIVYFQRGDNSFVLQFAYEDTKYVDLFDRMVAIFKFTSSTGAAQGQ